MKKNGHFSHRGYPSLPGRDNGYGSIELTSDNNENLLNLDTKVSKKKKKFVYGKFFFVTFLENSEFWFVL